jgi:signal transduction histidine kinase
MSQTIDDFRDFFSPDNQPVQFDLDIQITKTINILKDMYANQGIKIISQLKPCQLTSYAREFSQVLINILNNSKDAINEQKIKQPFIEVKMDLINNGRHVLITVLDNAGGIPENILDKIFDPYFTTKEETNGTGVGLYMSKTIIEKHMDGEIWAENVKDGALFSIRLPLGK